MNNYLCKINEILDLALEDTYPFSMRAARVIQLTSARKEGLITPWIKDLGAEKLHKETSIDD